MRLAMIVALALGCGNSARTTADAAHTADAAPGTFECDGMTCSAATQFCYEVSVGRLGRVAAAVTEGCNTLPTPCDATPSCACVLAGETFSCPMTPGCSVSGSAVTVVCAQP
jgi:hypothetical protein